VALKPFRKGARNQVKQFYEEQARRYLDGEPLKDFDETEEIANVPRRYIRKDEK
jgi:hypothetical protein